MRLIVGLGNPGARYARNRHNVGFMAVEAIARRYGFPAFRSRFKGELAEGTIAGERRLLLRPQTFMNASGESVLAAMSFYKIAPGDIVGHPRRTRPAAGQGAGQARRRQRRA